MDLWADTLFVLLILSNLILLGSSRLTVYIQVVAFQGVALGVLPWLVSHDISHHTLIMSVGGVVLKGWVFPWLLFRALREADVRREVEPFVGYTMSLMIGLFTLGLSLWLGTLLPLPNHKVSTLAVPVALFTMMAGLFLIVSRKKAITQVLGYLVMENGIYAFGVALVQKEPLIVELGVFLDIFVAVFLMGIAVFHINREFDHMDTDRLALLKDWTK